MHNLHESPFVADFKRQCRCSSVIPYFVVQQISQIIVQEILRLPLKAFKKDWKKIEEKGPEKFKH